MQPDIVAESGRIFRYFGFGWVWISFFFSTGIGSGLSKWKKSGRAKILYGM